MFQQPTANAALAAAFSPEDRDDSRERRRPLARRTAPPMDPTEQRVQEMLAEGGGVVSPRVLEDQEPPPSTRFDARSDVSPPNNRLLSWVEDLSHKWGQHHLQTLVRRKGRVSRSMDRIPEEMHLVANQVELVLELLDDFRMGGYRAISWRTIAMLVFGLLYAISPADVIPDALPLVGQLDDLAVLAIVTRTVNSDLRAFCRSKGYPEEKYFREPSPAR